MKWRLVVQLFTLLSRIFSIHCLSQKQFYQNLDLSESVVANDLAGMFSRSCIIGFGITGLQSAYVKEYKDRQWKVKCSQMTLHPYNFCRWTYDYVNRLEEKLKFQCSENAYIAGLYSDYNATVADRAWRIECCSSQELTMTACFDSDWLNSFGGPFSFNLRPNFALQGITGIRNSSKSDRKWKFRFCSTKRTAELIDTE